jgi:outer membrane protein assembly factor BamB
MINNVAYFGTFDNQVLALDLQSRKVLWRYEHPDRKFPFYSSAAVIDGTVVLGARDRMVHAIDAKTGKPRWTHMTRARIDSAPAIAGGRVYVGSNDGRLYALDLASGKVVWQHDEGAMMSNDGKWVAGVAHGGSTRPKDAPQFKPNGMLVMYRLDGDKLTKVSEAPIGAWSQGVSFSKDGKTVAAQNMIQKNIQVFKNDDGKLTDTGQKIEVGGGAAAIRSSTDR